MHKSQSHLTYDTHQELYDALTWSMLLDEATTKEGDNPNKVLKKRDRRDDQDKDPSAGPNQGMKKRRTGKDAEPLKKSLKYKESAKGKTPSTASKTGKSISADKLVQEHEHVMQMDVKEPNLDNVADDADEPQADAHPKILKKDWFKKSPKPETLDPNWNTVKTIDDAPEQSWFNEMIQAKKPPLTYKDVALGISHWGSRRQQFYRAMINKVSKHKVFSTMRILSVVSVLVEKRLGYEYLKEIIVRRANQKLYKFKKGDLLDLHLNDIEDMLFLIAQNKIFNLEGGVIVDFVTALKMFTRGIIVKNRVKDVQLGVESYQRNLNLTKPQRTCPHISVKEPYTPKYDPPGVIYKDKSKKKRAMRVDEIHKFCDGTLQSVLKIFRKRLLNFKFVYNKDMPLREWTVKDKRRTGIMRNKIDDQLFKRRVLRSLEVLVGGRKTKTDKTTVAEDSMTSSYLV
ncbi:hypothetical protein Tco_1450206 [Tanacetum coccineum]